MNYLFFLGRKSDLDFFELSRVLDARFPGSKMERFSHDIAIVELESDEDAHLLQDLLGGVVKTTVLLERISDKKLDLYPVVTRWLLSVSPPTGQIPFAIAEYGRDHKPVIDAGTVKQRLKEEGRGARFIDSPRYGLGASVLLHQNVRELHVIENDHEVLIAHTIGIQNIDDWTVRDRQKPHTDRKRGMLPPKLARILVNCALPSGKGVIYDPFCGTGTVLLEAMTIGVNAYGSDIRQDAVVQSQESVSWLKTRYPHLTSEGTVFLADAAKVEPSQIEGVTAIATEAYLGPLTPLLPSLPNIYKGLEKLYKGVFKQWAKVLPTGTVICIALPKVEERGQHYSLENFIDSLGGLGYNSFSDPYIYDRPETIVKRQIFLLEYTGK